MLSVAFDLNLELFEKKAPLVALQVHHAPLLKNTPFSAPIKWEEICLEKIDVVYAYGLEQHVYLSLIDWLENKKERKLIFLEDDLSVVRYFLEQEKSRLALENEQVEIYFLSEGNEEILKQIAWEHLCMPYLFVSTPSIEESREFRANALKISLEEFCLGAELTLSYYKDFGIERMCNQWRNVLSCKPVKKGFHLKNAFKGIPAVICGAGPSLNSEGEILQKVADSALIFGAGSAIGALDFLNVSPHFGVILDPNPPKERFLRRFDRFLPMFYQNALAHELFMDIEGERFCFDSGSSFPLSDFFFKQIGFNSPPFEAGWNVLNFAVHIATFLGCDPIICVGMDGCVEGNTVYARGVKQAGDTIKETKRDVIPCLDRFGKRVYSRSDFLMGKKWLEAFTKLHPDQHFINASSQGLRFDGFEEKRLSSIEKEIFFPRNLKGEIQRVFAQIEPINIDSAKNHNTLLNLLKSAKNCLQQIETLLMHYEKDFFKGEPFLENRYALPFFELENESFYEHLLEPVWDVWKYKIIQKEKKISSKSLFKKEIQKAIFLQKASKEYIQSIENILL